MTADPYRIVVRCLDDVQAAYREIAERRGMSREVIDEQAGMVSGYSAKCLAVVPIRGLGIKTMWRLAHGLGLRIVVEDDPERMAELADSIGTRVEKYTRNYVGSIQQAVAKKAARLLKKYQDENIKRSIEARWTKLSPEHRSRIARIAARARWKKRKRANPHPPAQALAAPSAAGASRPLAAPRTRPRQSAAPGVGSRPKTGPRHRPKGRRACKPA